MKRLSMVKSQRARILKESSVLPLCLLPDIGNPSTNGTVAGLEVHPPKPQKEPMADWFKVHNDLLDEDSFQYALSRHFAVGTVYLDLHCKASKLRNALIPWGEYILIGMAHRLHMGVGIINECVNALCECGYIAKESTSTIRLLYWDKVQSPYAKGISKRTSKKVKVCSKKLSQTSKKLHVEERRGEENQRSFVRTSGPPKGESAWLKSEACGGSEKQQQAIIDDSLPPTA